MLVWTLWLFSQTLSQFSLRSLWETSYQCLAMNFGMFQRRWKGDTQIFVTAARRLSKDSVAPFEDTGNDALSTDSQVEMPPILAVSSSFFCSFSAYIYTDSIVKTHIWHRSSLLESLQPVKNTPWKNTMTEPLLLVSIMFNKISEKKHTRRKSCNDWYCEIHICCPWPPLCLCWFPPRFDMRSAHDVTHRPHYMPGSHHSHTPRVEFLPIQIGKIELLIQLNGRNLHMLAQDAPICHKVTWEILLEPSMWKEG